MNEDTTKTLQDQTLILTDLILRMNSLEQLLISKGVIGTDELVAETKKSINKLTELVKQNLEGGTKSSE